MPHLQFEINKKLNKESKKKFVSFVEESFSKIMETGKDHIAVSIRELGDTNLSLGRAKNEFICLMNLDIRAGRTNKQKLKLIKTLISGVEKFFFIKKIHQYVTITNHNGLDFNFYEKSLADWVKNDDPANS
ncbi:MAG: tautomerase [Candidatus Pelagibacter sp.]|nr:tautomerase [Candidatus Pelagibacter sp.]